MVVQISARGAFVITHHRRKASTETKRMRVIHFTAVRFILDFPSPWRDYNPIESTGT
jgi:hypothetical protein